ncbi:MAG: PDZ domain-containing protein [Verrucomicrobiae bacterium]|nr:PDZ domain-containing protein [Verrucomicrobiae bacterium]NNJ43587.1 PDZ domain-containing protein [Akkermansiaceae bacterium]
MNIRVTSIIIAAAVAVGSPGIKAAENTSSFYKEPVLFNFTNANEKTAIQSIDRFGPVGISIELRLPPFQMYVKKVEDGSPAEATGQLMPGQKIESINGQFLKDIDPRIQLAKMITDAEASDGLIKLMIKETPDAKPHQVVVKIPVLGGYSKSWPLDCKKSDRIVRAMSSYLKEHGTYSLDTQSWDSLDGFGMLFLLSTGNPKDLDVVRGWVKATVEKYKDAETIPLKPWVYGSAAIPLAEYYLRTGDASILPVIQKLADHAKRTMYNRAWSGRGGIVFGYMAGGHMNAAGIHIPTFLLLAKECGVKVDDYTLQKSLKHFYRFAGKGSLAYGDGFPETYFIDNGKTGALAFTMAAAASLTPEGEKSVYAGARDVSAQRGFFGTNYMLVGHTGGGIGEVWRGPAMGLLHQKQPIRYRAFMDGRKWHLELSRRFDGSFGLLDGGNRYDQPKTWGVMMALQYTVPRQTLRLTGAPRTKFSTPYKLPDRPWGTKADDDFCSIHPASYSDGTVPQFDRTLKGGTANGIERHVRAEGLSDAVILKHAHHPDHEIRREIGAGYRTPEQDYQIVPMLKHKDARVRRAGLSSIHRVHKGTRVLPPERLTDEMVALAIAMINDPHESWWCVENALRVMSIAPPEKVAPHIDRLLYWLGHEEWWLQHAALIGLTPLAVDDRYYEKIMPKIGEMVVSNTHAVTLQPLRKLTERLQSASPKVQQLGVKTLATAYGSFPAELPAPGGNNPQSAVDVSLSSIAKHMMNTPGGFDVLFEVAKERYPNEILPYKKDYINQDTSQLSPAVQKALTPIFLKQLIPEYVTRNIVALRSEEKRERAGNPLSVMGGLADLHRKAGVTDYDWHPYGPDRNAMKWHYHSFDPQEKKVWMAGATRHRKITLPEGMEKWYSPEFDPVQAGWKSGLAPFGQDEGQLKTEKAGCDLPICRCGDPMKTLWDKEVLMIKGKFKFPPMKDGHSYRIIFGGASHVNVGDGPAIYINGRMIGRHSNPVRKRQGNRPRGNLIPRNMVAAFQGQEVELAAIAFMRMHKRTKRMGNFLTIWIEEMKNPPVNDQLVKSGLMLLPMQSSAWQQAQETDEPEMITDDGLFYYDGKFTPNPKLLATWTSIGQVNAIEQFAPGKALDSTRPRYKSLTFKDNGFTDSSSHYWSGDILMEILPGKAKPKALKMKILPIGGSDYLFIEAGGFTFYEDRKTYKQSRTWQCPWFVFKRK